MPVFRTAGIRSTGSPLPGVVNPSPGTVYPTSGVAAAGQFAIPNQQTLQAVRTTTAPAGVLGGQFGGGPMTRPTGQQGQFGMPQNVSNILNKPYQGSVVNLTGANNVKPSIQGFPGTDVRQPIPNNVTTPKATSFYTGANNVTPPKATASYTGANNAANVNQYNYLTPQQKEVWDAKKRREQINQLTTPYTGSLAAITGANMVEPSRQGFPGTDARQPIPISNSYLNNALPVASVPTSSSGYYDYGGSGGGGSGGYGNGYDYGGYGSNSGYGYDPIVSVLNWRVATG